MNFTKKLFDISMTLPDSEILKPLFIVRSPQTDDEWRQYYKLRFDILRKKWNQTEGSEKDKGDATSFHLAAFTENKIIAVGRIQFNNEKTAQIRFMAVDENEQGSGAGTAVLNGLEAYAKENNISEIILNARENAINFYLKNGYEIIADGQLLFGEIKHKVMRKIL